MFGSATASPTRPICWAGDGGTYDIGMATLSAAAERNEDILYICYDNEIYGNTGGQRSSATPLGAKTSTTPFGKREAKKDIVAIMAAHRVPYAATLSLAHHDDFMRKLRGGASDRRLSIPRCCCRPARPGGSPTPRTRVELVRLAVASGLFPLFEVFDGRRYRINERPDGARLEDYFSRQKRFDSSSLDIAGARAAVADQWAYLEALETSFPATSRDGGQARA